MDPLLTGIFGVLFVICSLELLIDQIAQVRCSPVIATVGVAHNIKMNIGITPLTNRVFGDITCPHNNHFTNYRRGVTLPTTYCPNGLGGSRGAVVDFILRVCNGPLAEIYIDTQADEDESTQPSPVHH
jgi:hypothetical protein